jgi:hypothetical protein
MTKSFALAVAASAWCFAGAQYTVEILHSPLVPAPNSYGAGAGGGQQVGHTNLFLAGPSRALLWEGTAKSLVDLHPAGWDASYAMATDGKRQVGWRERHTGQAGQFATMWSGSATGWVDLHAKPYFETIALGIAGNQQVGGGAYAPFPNHSHALMWNGSAGSMANLHPKGHERSLATATDGKQQVGLAGTIQDPRAALWTGSAGSYVDLHPSGYFYSEATGVSKGEQVGRLVAPPGIFHAGLWRSAKSTFVDLNPGKGFGSQAHATNGEFQVGEYAATVGPVHAARWSGTATSLTDLHELLPSAYHGSGEFSTAFGIDDIGSIVGWAAHVPTGEAHAVLWRPVPEPGTMVGLAILLLILVGSQRGPLKSSI